MITVNLFVKHLYTFLLVVLSLSFTQAQKGFEIGGWIGSSWYKGDLNPSLDLSQIGAAGGLIVKRNFNDRISLTSRFNYSKVRGDDQKSTNAYQLQRNLNFESSIFEWTPAFEFNFFPYNHGSQAEYFTPYLYVGFSMVKFNPKSTHNNTTTELQPIGTEGQQGLERYRLVSPGLAYGFGLKYDVTALWSVNVALNGRTLRSDYLDDVSTTYPGAGVLSQEDAFYSNPSNVDGFGAPGTQRGDSKTSDQYFMFSIGLFRYFGKLECPTISRIK